MVNAVMMRNPERQSAIAARAEPSGNPAMKARLAPAEMNRNPRERHLAGNIVVTYPVAIIQNIPFPNPPMIRDANNTS
jgi:hypothetical protein